jgi:hypothetical protein
MNGKGRSILVMVGVVSLSGFVARAELPFSVTLTAHEITPEEAVLSSHDKGSVPRLAQNAGERLSGSSPASSMHQTQATQGVLHGSSEAPAPGLDAGIPDSQEPPAEATRMHEPKLEGDHDTDHDAHQHDSGSSEHMMGAEDQPEHMTRHTGETRGPSDDMNGHMDDAGTDHSRMHETGMMGGSSHEDMHEGMMGGATEGDAGGRMHGGSEGPETGTPGGGHTGGMMGGGR